MIKRENYLNNRELLKQIHINKMNFCYVEDKKFYYYDLIVSDLAEVTPEKITEAKINKAKRLSYWDYEAAIRTWTNNNKRGLKPKLNQFIIEPETITTDELVYRVMCFDHIPLSDRKKNPKKTADEHIRCNFPPFKHFIKENNEWREVVRSHWKGDLETGEFSLTSGKINDRLGGMIMMLVDRYATRSNWRGYSYNDEMKGEALVHLIKTCLYFDESKSDNPFAYLTTLMTNSFRSVLNNEKKNQSIRDDMLQDNGYMPSYSRQVEDASNQQELRKEEYDNKIDQEQKDFGING